MPVDDGQRDERVAPCAIQMECDLIIVLAGPIEVDGRHVVNKVGIQVVRMRD